MAALYRVRGYFHAEAIAYAYAVLSVELGTLLLEEGRAREVRELAEEMMWIFKSQGIHKEALEALALEIASSQPVCPALLLRRTSINESRRF